MNNKLFSWGKFLIGWPLSIVSIFFVIKLIADQKSKLNINISDVNPYVVIIGVFLFFVYFLMRSVLWRRSLELKGNKINFLDNTYRFSLSEVKRYTPGNIWSFLSRGVLFKQLGVDNKSLGAALIADIQLVIIGCGIVSILIIYVILGNTTYWSQLKAFVPLSMIAIAIYFLATGFFYKNRYAKDKSILSSLVLPGFNKNGKIQLILISFITYAIFGLANYVVFASIFGFHKPEIVVLPSLFTFALLVGYLSFIAPTGLGIRELIVILGLSQAISTSDAAAMSIFTRIVLIISELSFLLIIIIWRNLKLKK